MTIVITGSESFVGKELISQCLKLGIQVIGFDLVASPTQDYEFHTADIRASNIADYIPEGVDALVHLAALSRDTDCRNKAYKCFDINVMGTLNLMKAAGARKVKQFIFASSEWVYDQFIGDEEKDEEAFINIANHTSEYALSKLVSEANLREQHQNGFCHVTILRFAIIYGPRKSNWSAVESVFSAVKNQAQVTIGSQKTGRRFVHVSDISRGIIKSIGLEGFNIINLAADKVITLGEIIETGQAILGKKVKVTESDPSKVSVRNPSNRKAKQLLNWEPEIDLETGLKILLPWV